MSKLVLIALGGAAGTTCRFLLGVSIQRLIPGLFPWGTFCVNMLGCLFFGLVMGLSETRLAMSVEMRAAILVGFMGAFTTFSTFAYDSDTMLRQAHYGMFFMHLAAQNLGGLVCVALGLFAGKVLFA